MSLTRSERDKLARDIAIKCKLPYNEVRSYITNQLKNYGYLIKNLAEDAGVTRNEMEKKCMYKYYTQFHGYIAN